MVHIKKEKKKGSSYLIIKQKLCTESHPAFLLGVIMWVTVLGKRWSGSKGSRYQVILHFPSLVESNSVKGKE